MPAPVKPARWTGTAFTRQRTKDGGYRFIHKPSASFRRTFLKYLRDKGEHEHAAEYIARYGDPDNE